MMNKITYNLVYNRKKCLNRRGQALVQVEAYLRGKKKYFSTKVYLRPDQWDNTRQLVRKHPNANELNRAIRSFVISMEQKELELWRQGRVISLDLLKDEILNEGNQTLFIPFFRREVESSSLRESTKHNHRSTLVLLQDFQKDVTFGELTFEYITAFEAFMRNKGYHINTIAKHMKHMKRYINVAINKGYLEMSKYAFRKYKIRTVASTHVHLSPEELERLERLSLDGKNSKYQTTLDAFLFCCYAGLRYSDFTSLTSDNVQCIAEKDWLVYTSVKTNTEVRLPLYLLFNGKALAILQKYSADLDDFFRLGNNSNVNKTLTVLMQLAGISKHISFHSARHTNATLLIYKGVNITTVQKLLGHKSVRTTQIYTDVMDMTVIQDLEQHLPAKPNNAEKH